jgi:hypothetical protein
MKLKFNKKFFSQNLQKLFLVHKRHQSSTQV